MKYIVMECRRSYAVLLDEEGRFLKAANLNYETGQIVQEPLLMREDPPKRTRTARWAAAIAAAAACLAVVFGIGYYQGYAAPYSSILLSINPEVRLELNRHGTVVSLIGTNEDGVALLDGYQGKGKDKVTVADELIDRAIAMGYLSEGGRVSFQIDTPEQLLFQEYGVELRSEVEEHLSGKLSVTIEITGSDSSSSQTASDSFPVSTPDTSSAPSQNPSPGQQGGDDDDDDSDDDRQDDDGDDDGDDDRGDDNDNSGQDDD